MSSTLTISVPELANEFQSGTLVAWRTAVGDTVQPGDIVAEIMTDKVNMEIESPHAGTVKALLVEVDDTVDVGQDIITLE